MSIPRCAWTVCLATLVSVFFASSGAHAEPPPIVQSQGIVEAFDAQDRPLPPCVGTLVAPDTILMPWPIADAAHRATITFSCCEPVAIDSIVFHDAARSVVLARVHETPAAVPVAPLGDTTPKVGDVLQTTARMPIQFDDVVGSFELNDLRVRAARAWPLHDVLLTLDGASTEVVMRGTPLLDADGNIVAISVDDAGNNRTVASPTKGVLGTLLETPIPIADFGARERTAQERSLAASYTAIRRRIDGDYAGGATAARDAIDKDAKNAEAWYTLGVCLDMTDQTEASVGALRHAVDIDPQYVESQYSLGLVLLKLEQFLPAIAQFDAAAAIDPDYADVHAMKGVALIYLERPGDAVPELEAATRLEPEDPNHWQNLEVALESAGRQNDIVAMWQRACEAEPEDADFPLALARAQLLAKHAGDAITTLRACLEKNPASEEARFMLSYALATDGQFDEAQTLADELAKLAPDEPGLAKLNAYIESQRGAAPASE